MATMYPFLVRIAAVLAISALAACGGRAKPPAAAGVEQPQTPIIADTPEQPAMPSVTVARPVPESARREIPPLARMTGLTGQQIADILGEPQFLRQDNAIELWQYRGDSCVLNLFLYPNNNELRVRHAEIQPRGIPAPVLSGDMEQSCLMKLTAAIPPAKS